MMQTKTPGTTVAAAISAIESLDLAAVALRLMDAETGKGWSEEHAAAVEAAYRKFLARVAEDPARVEDIAIGKDVDEFWHAHILHTRKYAQDCEAVFGCFLHHTPQPRETAARETAYCGAAIERTAAYCGAAIEHKAYCGAAIDQAAYCGAALEAKNAYCGAALEQKAYCGAALEQKPAYCGAALAQKPAYCGAALEQQPAYCGAALAQQPAYCGAALEQSAT